MKQRIGLFFKGVAMGAADIVPGVSGGTIALITGIYEELIESIKNINDELDETFDTNLFIKPGYKFKIVDRLITNFHASKSSLFVLVKTFSKFDIDYLYDHAIDQKYLFLSYGDAMLIER